MTKDEALKLALEALETLHDENMDYLVRNKLGGENNQCLVFAREAITAIKEALAQPEQKPVAWMTEDECEVYTSKQVDGCFQHDHIPLYTTPPQRTWVGLTEKDICEAAVKSQDGISPRDDTLRFAIAIEAKLKEKNT